MTDLLPLRQATSIRGDLRDYLLTTFALSDPDARDALDVFLGDPDTGMFKGPYVRLRLPFRPAEPGWEASGAWFGPHRPYGHQAQAVTRLSSRAGEGGDGGWRRPLPTLVTTGTGSGKTEAFLYPILDHVVRARRAGITGVKALILYPMNALANDQAQRLARLIATCPQLHGVTAGLYTGQAGPSATVMTETQLLTDRALMQGSPPDLLLTNYKMLDQLLLRHADHALWRCSAGSLQYLVLDEFHTYDGAQGTDVAMLLRRLGLVLAAHRGLHGPVEGPPLGSVTPVATSATLGDGGDPQSMLDFAATVFGEPFGPDAVIAESRLDLAEWVGDAPTRIQAVGLAPRPLPGIDVPALDKAVTALGDAPDGFALIRTVLEHLYAEQTGGADHSPCYPATGVFDGVDELLLDAVRAHPLVQALVERARDAVAVDDLVTHVTDAGQAGKASAREQGAVLVGHVLCLLGQVRARCGRAALDLDVHLWVRELTRIDRVAAPATTFLWGDDGPRAGTAGDGAAEARPVFPALYCRHCGRSGWGVGLAPAGLDLATDDTTIRRDKARRSGRFRALLAAPAEADAVWFGARERVEGLHWFSVRNRSLLTRTPADDDPELVDGWVLPVLAATGPDADQDAATDRCPACGQADGIRFLGSAIATLLSVCLSSLFGSPGLDAREKKALVFTDSVQDAAHRAGFVQARSHILTLRAVLNTAVRDGRIGLDDLVEEVLQQAGNDPVARYRIVPPDCADRDSFRPFWEAATLRTVPAAVRNRVKRRLQLDAMLEFGLQSRTGRTLELTGTAAAQVALPPAAGLARLGRDVLDAGELTTPLLPVGDLDRRLVQWVRGVVERMRTQGAIDHPWFTRYRTEDGTRWSIWGGRPRGEGMPAFPAGRPAPAYPRIGGSAAPKGSGLDAVTSPQAWYARWTSRTLQVSPADGGVLARLLFDALAREQVLTVAVSDTKARVYAIPPSRVVVEPVAFDHLMRREHQLGCDLCQALVPGTAEVIDQLDGAPCLSVRCRGTLARTPIDEHAYRFYRHLYTESAMRRIVAREHTSLLEDEVRREYEDAFRRSVDGPRSPNVLVATPTLELGIDIGDLSTVFLASLPRTVASYLQRVGRAGRLTGNALSVALVTGRGVQLPQLGEPLSVINGRVRPPATYLSAEEILRRQFIAHLVDDLARDPGRPHPRRASGVLGSADPGSFLGDLIAEVDTHGDAHLTRFLSTFGRAGDGTPGAGLLPEARTTLAEWIATPTGPGSSRFAGHLREASHRWRTTVEGLQRRRVDLEQAMPQFEARAAAPGAVDQDRRDHRSAQVALRMTTAQLAALRSEHWIGVLEEHGVLPNYTLFDDGVELGVGLSWMDPDSREFHTESMQMRRPAARAIREFAPGATFYARGFEILIDALDLGVDQMAVRPRAFCPDCGYSLDVAETGRHTPIERCPRCGSRQIADVRQRLDVVELQRVTSELRRDEAVISDRADERDATAFTLVATVDVDRAEANRQWFVPATSFGATYLTRVTVRWVNLGRPGPGTAMQLSGLSRPAPLFRICDTCGKLDTASGVNSSAEHRPWCRHRTASDEHTRSVALTRTLTTQGLLIRLPRSVTVSDEFAVPSLAAALLLGLREHLGGYPDHIGVLTTVDPTDSDGTDNLDALLLYDHVPGGTGYLAELADPTRMRELLTTAWRIVRDCRCADEERLACHRCLLPFLTGATGRLVARATAERHLRLLLTDGRADLDPATGVWELTDVPPESTDPETFLEQRFRAVLLDRLRARGATLQETPGSYGNTVTVTLPGACRRWTLVPQLTLGGCRPDFVLQCSDPGVPTVAVFADGHRYHATAICNRLREDARDRAALRDSGYVVVAVTAADLTTDTGSPVPAWYDAALVGQVQQHDAFRASPAAYQRLTRGPVDQLLDWITAPDPPERRTVARAVPMMLARHAHRRPVPTGVSLRAVAAAELTGDPAAVGAVVTPAAGDAATDRTVMVWRAGALAAAVESCAGTVHIALVLDDRDDALDAAHRQAWQTWLTLGNALGPRDWPTRITTVTAVLADPGSPGPVTAGIPLPRLSDPTETAAAAAGQAAVPPVWAALLHDALDDGERALLHSLATLTNQLNAAIPLPAVGHEATGGIPIGVCWPHRHVAVATTMTEEDRHDLTAAGWTVVPADLDQIVAALSTPGAD